DAGAVLRAPQARHRVCVLEPPRQDLQSRHVSLRGLRPAAVLFGDEVRQYDRLAELLGTSRQGDRDLRRPHPLDDADRSALQPLRRTLGPRLRRRPEADGAALLHEWRSSEVRAEVREAELIGATAFPDRGPDDASTYTCGYDCLDL